MESKGIESPRLQSPHRDKAKRGDSQEKLDIDRFRLKSKRDSLKLIQPTKRRSAETSPEPEEKLKSNLTKKER